VTTPADSHEPTDEIWFITELSAAMRHLETALQLSQSPERHLLPDGTTITEAQLRLRTDRNTHRTQNLLNQLQALLEEIAAPPT